MARSNELYNLMSKELPSTTYQRRLGYRTTRREVFGLFRLLNRDIFNDQLPMPQIEIMSNCRDYWGMCISTTEDYPDYRYDKSYCIIRLSDKWYCRQWLISMLAHEMCHQYQWDIEGRRRTKKNKLPIMSHGPSFFKWRNKLEKHGISLKTSYSTKLWFRHQNLFRC